MVNSYVMYLFLLTSDIMNILTVPNDIYLIASQKVLNGFNKDINEISGVHISLSSTEWWFPHHEISRFVLNGHLSSLVNIYNYYYRTGSLFAYNIFWKGVNATYSLIEYFIISSKQQYDLVGNVANYKYQALHVMLLDWLYEVTKIDKFKYFHDIFLESYLIETKSELTFNIQANSSSLNITGNIVWNRYATGDNRLYHRGIMLFEGYYKKGSYLNLQLNLILREKKIEDNIPGPLDANSTSYQINMWSYQINMWLSGIYAINIQNLTFTVNYVLIYLYFSSYIFTISTNQTIEIST